MADTERNFLVDQCQRKVAQADKTLASFVKKLSEHPVHACAWGDSAMKAAVEKEMYSGLKSMLMNVNMSLKELENMYLGDLMRGVNNGNSTSTMHNLINQMQSSVTSDILGMIRSVEQ